MKILDAVILSDAKTPDLLATTVDCINSLYDSRINIIVAEGQDNKYLDSDTFKQSKPFNYNKLMNEGARRGTAEYIGFFNNDLIFTAGWMTEVINAMNTTKADSASPSEPSMHKAVRGVIRNHRSGKELLGWAIVMRRSSWEKIGGLDESVRFWCAENVYEQQIKKHNLKHILVYPAKVWHKRETTLKTLSQDDYKDYTETQVKKFNKEFNQNLFGWGT